MKINTRSNHALLILSQCLWLLDKGALTSLLGRLSDEINIALWIMEMYLKELIYKILFSVKIWQITRKSNFLYLPNYMLSLKFDWNLNENWGSSRLENLNIRNFAKRTEWPQTELKESDIIYVPYTCTYHDYEYQIFICFALQSALYKICIVYDFLIHS